MSHSFRNLHFIDISKSHQNASSLDGTKTALAPEFSKTTLQYLIIFVLTTLLLSFQSTWYLLSRKHHSSTTMRATLYCSLGQFFGNRYLLCSGWFRLGQVSQDRLGQLGSQVGGQLQSPAAFDFRGLFLVGSYNRIAQLLLFLFAHFCCRKHLANIEELVTPLLMKNFRLNEFSVLVSNSANCINFIKKGQG